MLNVFSVIKYTYLPYYYILLCALPCSFLAHFYKYGTGLLPYLCILLLVQYGRNKFERLCAVIFLTFVYTLHHVLIYDICHPYPLILRIAPFLHPGIRRSIRFTSLVLYELLPSALSPKHSHSTSVALMYRLSMLPASEILSARRK